MRARPATDAIPHVLAQRHRALDDRRMPVAVQPHQPFERGEDAQPVPASGGDDVLRDLPGARFIQPSVGQTEAEQRGRAVRAVRLLGLMTVVWPSLPRAAGDRRRSGSCR